MKSLYRILSDVLEIDEQTITEKTSPENVANWDSFNALILVSELETNFQVKFSMGDVSSVKNVGDIKETLKKYNINV